MCGLSGGLRAAGSAAPHRLGAIYPALLQATMEARKLHRNSNQASRVALGASSPFSTAGLRRGATVPGRRVRRLARRRLQACCHLAHPVRRRIQTRTRQSWAGHRCREARRRRKLGTRLRVGHRLAHSIDEVLQR